MPRNNRNMNITTYRDQIDKIVKKYTMADKITEEIREQMYLYEETEEMNDPFYNYM